MSDNENGTWTRVGPSGPAVLPPLSGETCWVHDRGGEVGGGGAASGRWGSRVEADSGEVSGPVGEWMKGKEGVGR